MTVDDLSDQYSLGAVVYGLLTGKAPYAFKTYSGGEFIQILRDYDPHPPSAAITRVAGTAANDAPFVSAQRRRQIRGSRCRIRTRGCAIGRAWTGRHTKIRDSVQ